MSVQRYDEATTIEPVELPSGALRIDANLTRSGVFVYRLVDGSTRREYRPPEEVFAAESLATLRGAAVTDLHPEEPVGPSNWRALAVGHVGDDVRADGPFVRASVVVSDADEIQRVRAKERREISLGYSAELDDAPGVSPEGEPYDAIQRSIRYNHAALGPEGWGRAGPMVRLRLDGAGEACSIPPEEQLTMAEPVSAPIVTPRQRIDGVDHVVGTPEHLAAVERVIARRDAAEVEIKRRDRARILDVAKARGVRADEAMGDDAIIAAIVSKAFPGLSVEGKSHEVLMGLLEAATSGAPAAPATDAMPPKDAPAAPADGAAPPAPPGAPPVDEERADALLAAARPRPAPKDAPAPATPEARIAAARERRANAWRAP